MRVLSILEFWELSNFYTTIVIPNSYQYQLNLPQWDSTELQ